MKIIVNACRCKKCGDIIQSDYRHDFRRCKCGTIFIDGGKDYLRRGATNFDDIEDLSVVIEDE